MLPLGGLLIAVFAGWLMTEQSAKDELAIRSKHAYRTWYFLVRFVTPLGVVLVFLDAIDVI
jgi:NSS family neurotransmitter:Na+ symporter